MSKNITVVFPGGKQVYATIDGETIKTDQSLKNGGEGAHPEPFQLFLASLATCSGIYALEFCRKRELSTAKLSLEMECVWDADKKLFTTIIMTLGLPETFPQKYEKAIVRAVELCAVKKHLNPSIMFEIMILREANR